MIPVELTKWELTYELVTDSTVSDFWDFIWTTLRKDVFTETSAVKFRLIKVIKDNE